MSSYGPTHRRGIFYQATPTVPAAATAANRRSDTSSACSSSFLSITISPLSYSGHKRGHQRLRERPRLGGHVAQVFTLIPLSSITSRATVCSSVSPTSTNRPARMHECRCDGGVCCASRIESSRRMATIMHGRSAGSSVRGSGCRALPTRFCWGAWDGRSSRRIYASGRTPPAGSPVPPVEKGQHPDPST